MSAPSSTRRLVVLKAEGGVVPEAGDAVLAADRAIGRVAIGPDKIPAAVHPLPF